MLTAQLTQGKEKRVHGGHPWVFASDIERVENEGDWSPSEPLARIHDNKGRFIAIALYNPKSQITLRVISRKEQPINAAFWREKVRQSLSLRERIAPRESCRLIYGEADGVPGFIADRFGGVIAVQSLALGIEAYKNDIVDALVEFTGVENVYERSDAPVRSLEGLEQVTRDLRGSTPELVAFEENGLKLLADVRNGQKTGYFLDQRENRAAIARYVSGATVLDCFCHSGAFAMNAARHGATHATGVDISEDAVQLAARIAELNNLTNVDFVCANAFDFLRETKPGAYDVIILDPPAFTKTRKSLDAALRGYKEINLRAMKLLKSLPNGGVLVTCSCSQHVSTDEFGAMHHAAARDAKVIMRVLEKRGAGFDHPILMGSRETEYLKFWVAHVVES